MSFAQEIKDFVDGWKAGDDMAYKRAQTQKAYQEIEKTRGPTDAERAAQPGYTAGSGGVQPATDPGKTGSVSGAVAWNDADPTQKAFLNTLAGPESGGDYNIIYGGSHFDDYSKHPGQYITIESGPNKGKKSSAAGKYQFLESTWNDIASRYGLKDFSPENQDKAAWYLATETYGRTQGRSLSQDLQSGDPATIANVGKALAPIWTSLPSGIEQGTTDDKFVTTFNKYLQSAPDPTKTASTGGDTAIPEPQATSFLDKDTSGQMDANLVKVAERAARENPGLFALNPDTKTIRTPEEQAEYVKKGWAKTKNSKHLAGVGKAIDLVPINPTTGKPDANYTQGYDKITQAMRNAAKAEGVSDLSWGGDWKSFQDRPHWEVSQLQPEQQPVQPEEQTTLFAAEGGAIPDPYNPSRSFTQAPGGTAVTGGAAQLTGQPRKVSMSTYQSTPWANGVSPSQQKVRDARAAVAAQQQAAAAAAPAPAAQGITFNANPTGLQTSIARQKQRLYGSPWEGSGSHGSNNTNVQQRKLAAMQAEQKRRVQAERGYEEGGMVTEFASGGAIPEVSEEEFSRTLKKYKGDRDKAAKEINARSGGSSSAVKVGKRDQRGGYKKKASGGGKKTPSGKGGGKKSPSGVKKTDPVTTQATPPIYEPGGGSMPTGYQPKPGRLSDENAGPAPPIIRTRGPVVGSGLQPGTTPVVGSGSRPGQQPVVGSGGPVGQGRPVIGSGGLPGARPVSGSGGIVGTGGPVGAGNGVVGSGGIVGKGNPVVGSGLGAVNLPPPAPAQPQEQQGTGLSVGAPIGPIDPVTGLPIADQSRFYAKGGAIPEVGGRETLPFSERADAADYSTSAPGTAANATGTSAAIPESEPAPEPAPAREQGSSAQDLPVSRHIGRALDGGIKFLSRTFGLDRQQTGAIPEQGDAVARQAGGRRFIQGEGAATPQEMKAMGDKIDPDGTMPESDRALNSMVQGYQWYLTQGRLEDAQAMAGSILQYGSNRVAQVGSLAAASYSKYQQTGDPQALQDTLGLIQKAYTYVPDGGAIDIQLGDQGLVVNHTDADGKTEQLPVQADQIPMFIKGLQDKSLYWKQIYSAAKPEEESYDRRHKIERGEKKEDDLAAAQGEIAKEGRTDVRKQEEETRADIRKQQEEKRTLETKIAEEKRTDKINDENKMLELAINQYKDEGKKIDYDKVSPAFSAAGEARDALEQDPKNKDLKRTYDEAASKLFDALPPDEKRAKTMSDLGFPPESYKYSAVADFYTGEQAPQKYPEAKKGNDGYWYIPSETSKSGWARV